MNNFLTLLICLAISACSAATNQKILTNVQAIETKAIIGAGVMCQVGASLLPFIQTGTAVAQATIPSSTVQTVVADISTVDADAVKACQAINGVVVKAAS